MKRFISFLTVALFCIAPALADDGDQHLTINGGIQSPYTLDATIGYEYEFKNGHAAELYAEAGNHWHTPVCHAFWTGYFWDGGATYKYRIAKFKNGNLKIRGGVQFGSFVREFFIGAELGFEYNYVFKNNWEFALIQKNNFDFIHGDTFRNGLMVGLKIPF